MRATRCLIPIVKRELLSPANNCSLILDILIYPAAEISILKEAGKQIKQEEESKRCALTEYRGAEDECVCSSK